MAFKYVTVQSGDGEILYMSSKEIQCIPKLAALVESAKNARHTNIFKIHNVSGSTINIIRQYVYYYGKPDGGGPSNLTEVVTTESVAHAVTHPQLQSQVDPAKPGPSVSGLSVNTFWKLLGDASDDSLINIQKAARFLEMESLVQIIAEEIKRRNLDG